MYSLFLHCTGHDGCILLWDMLAGDHLKMFKIEVIHILLHHMICICTLFRL